MKIDASSMEWIRKPKSYRVTKDKVEIMTEPHTDLWQRTYYHFKNDNAPKEIRFGIYACSAEESSFLAAFTDMEITECAWKAHDGQQPD